LPSHDLAARLQFIDFHINAVGTMNLLESNRHYITDELLVFINTNKVYKVIPNVIPQVELDTRCDYLCEY